MLRRNGSGRLGAQRNQAVREDVNPMATVSNLVDAMLVLAVGIMLALIVSWNLNIAENGQINDNAKKEDAITDFNEEEMDDSELTNDQLQKEGTVYYDAETDKYYVITN